MAQKNKNSPPLRNKILIVGGYGQVGRAIAKWLAPLYPGRVAIAGRSLNKAVTAASEIGHNAEGRTLDIFSKDLGDTLDDVALALVCLDQTDTHFVEHCFLNAIHYIDISANYDFLSRVEKLNKLAKQKHVTAILSVGVAPGLTNLLAARAREKMPGVEQIDILLELGLGDHHGQAALEWMFDNLDAEYEIRQNGQPALVRSFSESLNLALPGQAVERPAYRFNFPDQHIIARTLDIASVSTWIRFDDRISTWLFARFSNAGLARLLRRSWMRKAALWLFMRVHVGSDICGVAVHAKAETQTLILGLTGRKEAQMTAIAAAETARQVISGQHPPGVHHSGQAIALDPIISALKSAQPDLIVDL